MTYVQVQLQRYLEPRGHVARASDHLDWLLYELDDKRFKQEVRMTRQSFQDLLVPTENHPVFKNNSNNRQRPVHHQLLVTLKRLGCFGNGAAVGIIARAFGLSGNVLRSRFLLSFYLYSGSEASSFRDCDQTGKGYQTGAVQDSRLLCSPQSHLARPGGW